LKKLVLPLLLAAAVGAPVAARCATVDASLIPDGTYVVKVEKVLDNSHLLVLMQNGVETTITAKNPTVDFSKVKANDTIKLSLIKGQVPVYLIQ
jgi:type 1 fimbria pilin